MFYHSTRGAGSVSAAEALLRGTAPDGGLYLPDVLPNCADLLTSTLDYAGLAGRLFTRLLPGLPGEALEGLARVAYGPQFDHPDITPLVSVGENRVLELFHGPTAAFKDLALQALPRLMALARGQLDPGGRYAVLVATSGDTGPAALRGFAGLPGFTTLVYYPVEGVSPVQRAQLLALGQGGSRAVAIRGDFDQAQAGVKAALAQPAELLPRGLRLTSANSINIGRLVPQVVYYVAAIRQLLREGCLQSGQLVDFIVPTGNFGDVYAGFLARGLGLPVGRLTVACNANRVLADFIHTGVYDRRRALKRTLSPSMDILVSSNLERLLYEACGRDAGRVKGWMDQLRSQGHYRVDADTLAFIQRHFSAHASNDAQALDAMRRVHQRHGYLLDPHTAAAWLAAQAQPPSCRPRVVLATASPFKFPEAALRALGQPVPGDGRALLSALARASGMPVPAALSGLEADWGMEERVIDSAALVADAMGRVAT